MNNGTARVGSRHAGRKRSAASRRLSADAAIGGGDSIYKASPPVTTSPLTLTESDWKEGPDERTIKSDDTKDIRFKFENDVVEDTDVYSIVLTFGDGSTVTFGG